MTWGRGMREETYTRSCAAKSLAGRLFIDAACGISRAPAKLVWGFCFWAVILAAALWPSAAQAQFAIPGKFAVSSTAAATYGIPISVPPGTHGVAPSLSLDYNSQGTNGMLGLGWSLSGLPSVTRCPQTIAQDNTYGSVNYDANDRFCLDGQRLIAISGTYGADGTQYRTERNTYSEVVSHGAAGAGPAWFEIHTKAGLEMDFGNTTDSKIPVQGSSTVRMWDLNKATDPAGNYYTVSYTADSSGFTSYPCTVNYTGNAGAGLTPYNSVQFLYDTSGRPDKIPFYRAGALVQTNWRLTDINTYNSNVTSCGSKTSSLVNDYKLAYQTGVSGRSELTSVTLYDANSNSLPPTVFTWQGQFVPFATQVSGSAELLRASYFGSFGSYTGSSRPDSLNFTGTPPNITSYVNIANEDGTFTYDAFNLPSGCNATPSPNIVSGDWNGDGKTDIGCQNLQTGMWTFYLSTGAGFVQTTQLQILGTTIEPVMLVGDFDGNGRSDILAMNTTTGQVQMWLASGTGCSVTQPANCTFTKNTSLSPTFTPGYPPLLGDFDGDGRTDILTWSSDAKTIQILLASTNFTTGPTITVSPSNSGILTGDWNGDGKTDLAFIPGESCSSPAQLYLSTGTGFQQMSYAPLWCFNGPIYRAVDFNGDGMTDIVRTDIYAPDGAVFLSTGSSFVQQAAVPPTGWLLGGVGDINGDGAADVAAETSNYSSEADFLTSFAPDLISVFTDGLGASTTVTYSPLDRVAIYTKGNSAQYPTHDVTSTTYVVSKVQKSNGIGGNYSTGYAYTAGQADLSGRGFLGFSSMIATDQQTNIVSTINYNLAWPLSGLVSSATKVLNGCTLDSVTNSYTSPSTAYGSSFVWQTLLSQSVETPNEMNGCAPLPAVTTTHPVNSYDAFGNPLVTTVSASDGYSKTTTNTYTNMTPTGSATTPWILGLLTNSVVQAQAPTPPTPPTSISPVPSNALIWGSSNWGSPKTWY